MSIRSVVTALSGSHFRNGICACSNVFSWTHVLFLGSCTCAISGLKRLIRGTAVNIPPPTIIVFFYREPAINPHISICKPPLKKNMVCGPINFFRTVYVGAEVQTACGPCEKDLICKQVGYVPLVVIIGSRFDHVIVSEKRSYNCPSSGDIGGSIISKNLSPISRLRFETLHWSSETKKYS